MTVLPQQFTANQYTALNIAQSQLLAGDSGSSVLAVSNPTQPANATSRNRKGGESGGMARRVAEALPRVTP